MLNVFIRKEETKASDRHPVDDIGDAQILCLNCGVMCNNAFMM